MNELLETDIRNKLDQEPTICRKDLLEYSELSFHVHDAFGDVEAMRAFVRSLRPDCNDDCGSNCPYSTNT